LSFSDYFRVKQSRYLCVLLNVGVYLEHMFPTEMNGEGLVTCLSIAKKSYNTKKRAGKILSEIFTSDDFETSFGDGRTSVGNVFGSHSLRKCAATHARRNGCSRDEIDLRGRWKHLKRQVDTYLDTSVPYPDAKVCLCSYLHWWSYQVCSEEGSRN